MGEATTCSKQKGEDPGKDDAEETEPTCQICAKETEFHLLVLQDCLKNFKCTLQTCFIGFLSQANMPNHKVMCVAMGLDTLDFTGKAK